MHDLHYLPEKCNRAVIIHNGEKYFDGAANELYSSAVLHPIYQDYTDTILKLCQNSFN